MLTLKKELNILLNLKALWIMLIILSLLTGFSFIQAVDLFSKASSTALNYPEMAKGMIPFTGIFIPTFGALYLVLTILFPFITIPLVSGEKQNGSLKLLLQTTQNLTEVILIKVTSLIIVGAIIMLPSISSIVIWKLIGGHIYLPALLNLILGYSLYALIITAISFLAASFTETTATAAIVTLAFTLGSWVLDFAAMTQSWLSKISFVSLTALLTLYEKGLFSLSSTIQILVFSLGVLLITSFWLRPGNRLLPGLIRTLIVFTVLLLVLIPITKINYYKDVTENRFNSFSRTDEAALKQMSEELTITIHLSIQDSRLHDYRTGILDKLDRLIPSLNTINPYSASNGELTAENDDLYGLIEYDYNGKHEESWSNSHQEVLPIIYQLAGISVVPDSLQQYPGYPLVSDASSYAIWFYVILPGLFIIFWLFIYSYKSKGKKVIYESKPNN